MAYLHSDLKDSGPLHALYSKPSESDEAAVDEALSHYYDEIMRYWKGRLRILPVPVQCAVSEDFDAGYSLALRKIEEMLAQEQAVEKSARVRAAKRLGAKKQSS